MFFHYRELEYKSRKSRATRSNRQIWPWSTKLSRAKANRVLPRERTSHSKHLLPPTNEKILHMDITRWSILKSDWVYSLQPKLEKLYIVSKNKTGSWLWIRSWTPYCKAPITDPKKKIYELFDKELRIIFLKKCWREFFELKWIDNYNKET